MFGLHILDLAVIAVALAMILGVGVWMSRSVRGESDFYLGGRKLGKGLQFFLSFGNMTDSTGGPTIASEVLRQGVGGMWIGFQTLFITPFFWFMPVWFRRIRLVTMADLFIDRFDSRLLATTYAAFSVVVALLGLGLGNVISYKVTSAIVVKPESAYTEVERRSVADFHEFRRLRGQYAADSLEPASAARYAILADADARGALRSSVSYIRPIPFYVGYKLIVCIYITLGGLKAAAVVDALQGLLILAFTVMLIPLGLREVGGPRGLHALVPEYMFRTFGTAAGAEYTWYAIAAIWFTSLIQMVGLMHNMGSCGSAKNESAARFGMVAGGFCKRLVIIAWMFCGLLAFAIFPQGLADPDNAWGLLSRALLGPGLMGLMIAGMLLGHMPAVGTQAISVGALVTKNVYEPLVAGRSQAHYVRVGQVAIGLVLAASIVVSLFFTGVIALITTLITFNAFFGATVLLMFFWRGLTARAVSIALVIWVALIGVAPFAVPHVAAFRGHPRLLLQTREQTVSVISGATRDDVEAGRASRVGDEVTRPQRVPPASVFFDAIARAEPEDPASPLEGVGRFNVETFTLGLLGVPVDRLGKAGLLAARWAFDGVLPFVLLVALSHLTRARRGPADAAMRERIDRFYVRLTNASRADARGGRARRRAQLRGAATLRSPQAIPAVRLGGHAVDARGLRRLPRELGDPRRDPRRAVVRAHGGHVRPLRLATIGTWGHVATVLDELGAAPGLEIVAAAKALPDEDLGAMRRWPLAAAAKGYDDYREMIRDARPDVAIVSTRLDRLAPIGIDVAEAGVHLICEKPLSLDRATLRRFYHALTSAGTCCLPMLNSEADPAVVATAQAVRAGLIGSVALVDARKSYKWGERPAWFGDRACYGGTIPWVGIHALDMIYAVSGRWPTRISAMHANVARPQLPACEDHAVLIVDLGGAVHATASIDLLRPAAAPSHGEDWLRVVGGGGTIEAHVAVSAATITTHAFGPRPLPLEPSRGFFAPMLRAYADDAAAWRHATARGFLLTDAALCARDAADAGRMLDVGRGPWHDELRGER